MEEDKAHAVRWFQREVKSRWEEQYSKWHWTEDATKTICGKRINIFGAGFLPETDDCTETVDCKRCMQKLRMGK